MKDNIVKTKTRADLTLESKLQTWQGHKVLLLN